MAEGIRLDQAVVERGLATSREKAKIMIASGRVTVDGKEITKPGVKIQQEQRVEARGEALPYVSRGGWKLEKAVKAFSLDFSGMICADIGASSGGFTDCMLQNGAALVYAVDVGHGQLDPTLRDDPRVINLEGLNFRHAAKAQIPLPLDFASVDVSFISLRLILPVLARFLKPDGRAVCLIKPQFEAGREQVGKNGVVRSREVHRRVVEEMTQFALQAGYAVLGLTYSPIKGPQGNIEYLLYLQSSIRPAMRLKTAAEQIVAWSHEELDRGGNV